MDRLLICGSRYWTEEEPIRQLLEINRDSISVVIHGGANGADSIAGRIATQLGIPVISRSAEWNKYGKRAGILRNIEMLEKECPTRVVAYTHDLQTSRGTSHMVEISRKKKIPVLLYCQGKYTELN